MRYIVTIPFWINRSSSMRLSSTWSGERGNNFLDGKYGKLVTEPNSFFSYILYIILHNKCIKYQRCNTKVKAYVSSVTYKCQNVYSIYPIKKHKFWKFGDVYKNLQWLTDLMTFNMPHVLHICMQFLSKLHNQSRPGHHFHFLAHLVKIFTLFLAMSALHHHHHLHHLIFRIQRCIHVDI